MSGEIVCSFEELDVLGEALRLDVRQFPFSIPHFAVEAEERLRLGRRTQDDFVARGLIRDGHLHADFVNVLKVYTRGRISIAMRGELEKEQHLALAVIGDRACVLAVQQGETLRFAFARPESVVRRLVGLLPQLKAGPGTSVTVVADPVPVGGRRPQEDFSEFTFTSAVRADANAVKGDRAAAAEIFRRPRLGGGDFLVTVRDRNGRQNTPAVMSWLDTQAGRYAAVSSADSAGRLHATYIPADPGVLDRQLTRIVHSMS
ncbi:hypothetical protein BBK82_43640 [Lentzea guizhouensis]|uniref:ESX secretion-associated protein EspG n=1 Tax=Lentzea guizhouensis TaxID=1586287 RepID=A0A1B2HVR0_9PSEU|nr:ESX secretion-associated protein EspG [Lentzea guizhouensis]ANZ41814.1 hypothetical protein BBK82_43640 [Lentzea guizhouensis]